MRRLVLQFAWLLIALPAYAHKPSDSYLGLSVDGAVVGGQWDIALRDLDFALGLDTNGDAEIAWGEVRAKHGELAAYAMARLALSTAEGPCPARVTEHLIDDHTDGAYAVIRFQADCPKAFDVLRVRYGLFFDIDPQHKGLLRLDFLGASTAAIFSPEKEDQTFSLVKPSRLR